MLNQRLKAKPMRTRPALPHYAFPIRVIKLLLTLFGKKQPENKLAHLREWEREKIIKLGLAINSSCQNRHQKQHVNFTSWDSEKVVNFDLAKSLADKKSSRNRHVKKKQPYLEISEASSHRDTPSQAREKYPPPIPLKKDQEIDDFFKILGYE